MERTYLGSIHEISYGMRNIKLSPYDFGHDMDTKNFFLGDMSVNVEQTYGNYVCRFVYNQSLFKAKDIKEIASSVEKLLSAFLKQQKERFPEYKDDKGKEKIQKLILGMKEEMDAYEKAIVANNDYQDYLLTGIQRVSYEIKSRNAVMELPIFDSVDVEKFQQSWMKLHQMYDVLRSSILLPTDSYSHVHILSSIDLVRKY